MLCKCLGIASLALLLVIVLVCFSNMSAGANPVNPPQDSNREPFKPLDAKIFTSNKSLLNDGNKNDAEREMENFLNNSSIKVKFISQSSNKDAGADYYYTVWTIWYENR